jgi:hypothetical protein
MSLSQEENMRKLVLSLAAAAAILATGALTAGSQAMTSGGLRPAITHAAVVGKARMVCGHVWNGRHHHTTKCVRARGGHKHRHAG